MKSIIACAVLASLLVSACRADDDSYSPFAYGTGATAPGLQWFKPAHFGMFMHYGPVSQWSAEISFPLVCKSFPCTMASINHTTVVAHNAEELAAHRQAYANLQHTFNPTLFNASAMADLAYAAGFRYIFYTTVHCDGFINWKTQLSDYNILNTPYGKDIFGEITTAFRQRGIRVGAYVCPSLWNNDNYWAPNASTTLGPVCAPSYDPQQEPQLWSKYITFLHGLVTELTNQYQVDAFWFDCSNSPPKTDTFFDQLLPLIRKNNPDALVLSRNGVFSDYVETNDQSESLWDSILGQEQELAGIVTETPAVLQTSRQWAYDAFSGQKPATEILANLILLTSKNGNYLLNVAPGPTGLWADSAVQVLQQLAAWFSVNGEAIHGATPLYPAAGFGIYLTARNKTVYVLLPQVQPDSGAPSLLWSSLMRVHKSSRHQLVTYNDDGTTNLTLPYFRPNLLRAQLQGVQILGSNASISYQFQPAGLVLSYSPPPIPALLRSYWSSANNDTAPCATRYSNTCDGYTEDAYVLLRAEATCYANQISSDMQPLSLIYNTAVTDNGLRNASWTVPGYDDIDVECYGWSQPGPGRVPLDLFYNAARHDYWALAAPASRVQAAQLNYSFVVTLGYVLPASSFESLEDAPLATTFKMSFAN